ncbi:MAG: cytochrome C [Deltaproteobacteria bacterium]|nr:cytochrome C [Deltaproteobacteria bacterium]
MLFPVFYVPGLGQGMTIALVAVLHVVLSHGLALGVVSLVVLLEHLALRRNDPALADLAQHLLKPAVVIITAVGAVTGAGIWFTVSVLAPAGIGSLLRVFFWPWFIEWIAFTLEVLILLPYYFLWDRLRPARQGWHVALGWSYVAVALVSAFLISGILGFMLTPDGWVQNQRLVSAFFNPTFWPQLALRFFGGLALGALFCLGFLLFSRQAPPSLRESVVRLAGGWLLAAGGLCALATWLYFQRVPQTYFTHSLFAVLTSHLAQKPWLFWLGNLLAVLLLAAVGAAALTRRRLAAKLLIIPALVLAIGLVAEFERIREFIRGPYLMPGYQYANQINLSESLYLKKRGFLAHAAWYPAQPAAIQPRDPAGHALFASNCGVCHTIGGINDIRGRLRGRTQPSIYVLINNANRMVPFMPPFSGTEAEARTLGAYLYALTGEKRSLQAVPPAVWSEAAHE